MMSSESGGGNTEQQVNIENSQEKKTFNIKDKLLSAYQRVRNPHGGGENIEKDTDQPDVSREQSPEEIQAREDKQDFDNFFNGYKELAQSFLDNNQVLDYEYMSNADYKNVESTLNAIDKDFHDDLDEIDVIDDNENSYVEEKIAESSTMLEDSIGKGWFSSALFDVLHKLANSGLDEDESPSERAIEVTSDAFNSAYLEIESARDANYDENEGDEREDINDKLDLKKQKLDREYVEFLDHLEEKQLLSPAANIN